MPQPTLQEEQNFNHWVALSFAGEQRDIAEKFEQALRTRLGFENRIFYDRSFVVTFAEEGIKATTENVYKNAALVVVLYSSEYCTKSNPQREWLEIHKRDAQKSVIVLQMTKDIQTEHFADGCDFFPHGTAIDVVAEHVVSKLTNVLRFDVLGLGRANLYFSKWHTAAEHKWKKDLESGSWPPVDSADYVLRETHIALAGAVGMSQLLGQSAHVARKLADVSNQAWAFADGLQNESAKVSRGGSGTASFSYPSLLCQALHSDLRDGIDSLLEEFTNLNSTEPDKLLVEATVQFKRFLVCYVPHLANDCELLISSLITCRTSEEKDSKNMGTATGDLWTRAKEFSQGLCTQMHKMLNNDSGNMPLTNIFPTPSNLLEDAIRAHTERLAPHLRRFI